MEYYLKGRVLYITKLSSEPTIVPDHIIDINQSDYDEVVLKGLDTSKSYSLILVDKSLSILDEDLIFRYLSYRSKIKSCSINLHTSFIKLLDLKEIHYSQKIFCDKAYISYLKSSSVIKPLLQVSKTHVNSSYYFPKDRVYYCPKSKEFFYSFSNGTSFQSIEPSSELKSSLIDMVANLI